MFQPSAPLLPTIPHLYTATSFQAPPQLAAPTPPDDWVSYNTVEPNGPPGFEAFKASPAFKTTQDQFLERIAACEQFASQHFPAKDAAKIRSGLDTFRSHLLLNDGATFFNASLPKLYGSGKRHFDHFCLRLTQEDIDLHRRKTALRELAADLPLCRSSGAAFRTASKTLSGKPGGLHGEFHALLLRRIDALLQEVVRRGPGGEPLSTVALKRREEYLLGMEVHAVNRLRMELDLPGAERDDRYTCDNVVTPGLIHYAQDLLRGELHPAELARDLAESYLQQLRELLPPEARSPTAELTDSMSKISDANAQMGATFGHVPLNHLLHLDEASGQTFWQNDVSLLATDLLKSLEEKDLVVRQALGKALSHYTPPHHWDLLHLDWRLFLASERDEPAAEPVEMPVQIHHALALLHRLPRLLPLHALTDTLLSGGRPENLARLPAHWLEDEAQCLQHCRALGDEGMKRWIGAASPLPADQKKLLTSAMTQLNLHQSLPALMASDGEATPREWIEWAGGFGLLRQLLASQPAAEVLRFWAQKIDDYLPAARADELRELYGSERSTSLITRAMRAAPMPVLKQLLLMTLTAREGEILSDSGLYAALRAPIQQLMKEGRTDAFIAYADTLDQMASERWIDPPHLRLLLEGPNFGDGCRGALQAGHAALVQAFHATVRLQHSHAHLTTDMARCMVMGAPAGRKSCGWEAIEAGHSAALAAHLKEIQNSVLMGLVPRDRLRDVLRCQDDQGYPGLASMVVGTADRHPCLDVWMSAVLEAHRHSLLTLHDTTALLHARDRAGTPVLHHILQQDQRRDGGIRWLYLVHLMHADGALPPGEVALLLESRLRTPQWTGETLLSEAIRGVFPEGAIRTLLEIYGRAHGRQLVSAPELVRLVRAEMDDVDNAPFLIVAMHGGRVAELNEYLDGIQALAEGAMLDETALLTLLDPKNAKKESALTLALINKNLPAVEAFLQTTLALAEQGRLSGEAWCRLMMPLQDGRPIYELSSGCSNDLLRMFDGAMQRAEQAGLLGGSQGGELALLWRQFRMPLPEASEAPLAPEALQPPVRLRFSDAEALPQDDPRAPGARSDATERPSVAAGRAAMARAAMAVRQQADAAQPPPPAPHQPMHRVAEPPHLLQIPPRRGAWAPPLPQRREPQAAEPPELPPPLPPRPRPAARPPLPLPAQAPARRAP
ncbi:hypothetical protein [Roseateles terrae]|uniref:Uncharacterized protein n=1 Tax=Roseateles terrae TaxID=431060 RepID=A0ABR6H097_9BURK|nr:hypothetical protein [Roseateles terrae]MBB3197054.1 hypothetical protein [Roseateles terrae]OWQ84219.1 hypothetical protein CDN98_19745 [Roseateles terrae]